MTDRRPTFSIATDKIARGGGPEAKTTMTGATGPSASSELSTPPRAVSHPCRTLSNPDRRVTAHQLPDGVAIVIDDPVRIGDYVGWRYIASAFLDENSALELRDALIEGLA